jgi:hypothetical protein
VRVVKAIVRHDVETATGVHRITQRVDLDEIVIPDLLHAEDMGDGVWHVALGDGLLTFSVGPGGVTTVEDLRRRK